MYVLSKVIYIRKLGGFSKLGEYLELGLYWVNLGYVMGSIGSENNGDRSLRAGGLEILVEGVRLLEKCLRVRGAWIDRVYFWYLWWNGWSFLGKGMAGGFMKGTKIIIVSKCTSCVFWRKATAICRKFWRIFTPPALAHPKMFQTPKKCGRLRSKKARSSNPSGTNCS